jgi:hypothetical protein
LSGAIGTTISNDDPGIAYVLITQGIQQVMDIRLFILARHHDGDLIL